MVENISKTSKAVVLFILPLLLYIATLEYMPLVEPDEGRYGLIPQEMNLAGDYVTPKLKGVDYFEKPVLEYWGTALCLKIFGDNAFASRLFVALCAWGCIILVYRMGRRFHGEKTGVYCAALLSTTIYHFAMGRAHVLDMPLSFFVCMAIWSCYRFIADDIHKRIWLYLAYFFAGLAFLTKGLIGIVFPFAVAFFYMLFTKRYRFIFRLVSPLGILILAAVAGPWLYLVQKANPDFFHFFFIREHLQRFTTTVHNRYEPFWFFIPILFAGFIPWLGYLPEAIRGMRPKIRTVFKRDEIIFLFTWAGFIMLFFSASSSKLVPYIAPVFIPLSVMAGHIFRNYDDTVRLSGHINTSVFTVVPALIQIFALAAGIILLPIFDKGSQISFAAWIPWIIAPVAVLFLLAVVPGLARRKLHAGWFFSIYFITALLYASMLVPVTKYITPYKSSWPIVQAIKQNVPAGAVPVQFKMSSYGVDFYLKMRTPVVDDYGELDYGVAKLSPADKKLYFPSSADFKELYMAKEELWCITDDIYKVNLLKEMSPSAQVLWQNREFFLVHMKKHK